MEFLLSSGNAHKAEEFGQLFDPNVLKILAAPKKIEVAETGNSYFENSLLKAKAYYEEFKRPTMADDSGLNVQALPDELGVQSARFGGAGLSDRERYLLLLEKLQGLRDQERAAHFTCVLCFYLGPEQIFYFEGRVNGQIGVGPAGEQGFGYDPIFLPEGLDYKESLAQRPDWKQKNSHRARAVSEAVRFFSIDPGGA